MKSTLVLLITLSISTSAFAESRGVIDNRSGNHTGGYSYPSYYDNYITSDSTINQANGSIYPEQLDVNGMVDNHDSESNFNGLVKDDCPSNGCNGGVDGNY